MFQVTSEMIEKLKDALRLQPVPAVNGPRFIMLAPHVWALAKNSCSGTCRGSCQGGCTRSCKGHSR